AASSLAFYSLSASKLASYSLALIPPLSALIGLYLDDVIDGSIARAGAAFRWTAGILAAAAAALATIPLWHGTSFRLRDLTGGVPGSQAPDAIWSLVTPVAIVCAAGAVTVVMLPHRGRILALALTGFAVP